MTNTLRIGTLVDHSHDRLGLVNSDKPSANAFATALSAAASGGAGAPSAPAGASGQAPAGAPGGPDAPGGQPAGDPNAPPKLSADDKRPDGDTRSAKDIVDGDPTLKNLGNQSGVKDNLKKQVGDFDHDPDAAYRASQVLQHIKQSKTSDGKDRSGDVTKGGKIEGFTKDGDARHGTEAGLLQDFGKNGYSALQDNQKLDKTNDKHVKQDGTNMDNTTFAGHEIAHGLSQATGWTGKQLDKLPGPLKAFLGPLHMTTAAISGGLNVADTALTGGDTKQAGKDTGPFSSNLTTQGIGPDQQQDASHSQRQLRHAMPICDQKIRTEWPCARNRWRRVFTAGARRKQAPKTAFRGSRCRAMKATIFW